MSDNHMRFSALDGVRGCCALFVVLYHATFLSHFFSWPLIRNSYLFVDFFFVLSGFVICHTYHGRLCNITNIYNFLLKRIARLWPLHMAILSIFVLSELIKLIISHWVATGTPAFFDGNSVLAIFTNLLLIQSLDIHKQLTWNSPSWSISVEFYTYVVFAFIAGARYKNAFFALAASIGLIIILMYAPEHNMDISYDYGFFRCLYGFFLGCMTYTFFTNFANWGNQNINLLSIGEFIAAIGTIAFICLCNEGIITFFAPVIFSVLVFIMAFEAGAVSKILKGNIFQKLGLYSYSIYMVHYFIVSMMNQLLKPMCKLLHVHMLETDWIIGDGSIVKLRTYGNIWITDGLTVLYVAIVIVTSLATYKYIEMPGKDIFRHLRKHATKLKPNI
jgi:peptidoglycan/LPS O-acetylase OafA/YrhL